MYEKQSKASESFSAVIVYTDNLDLSVSNFIMIIPHLLDLKQGNLTLYDMSPDHFLCLFSPLRCLFHLYLYYSVARKRLPVLRLDHDGESSCANSHGVAGLIETKSLIKVSVPVHLEMNNLSKPNNFIRAFIPNYTLSDHLEKQDLHHGNTLSSHDSPKLSYKTWTKESNASTR